MYIIGIYLYNTNLFINTYNMIKVMYFPVLLITLYELREHIKISNMTIFTSIYLYLILIFIPLLLNMGYNSYKITKVGSTGLYNSANEISGLIGITTPILFIIFKENRKIDIDNNMCIMSCKINGYVIKNALKILIFYFQKIKIIVKMFLNV